ncbi:MAG: glycosyltransferase family 2 protein [Rhizomicrobium sp.]
MTNPIVSIITPTYNREAFLPAIIACVQKQTCQEIEWLVLDDSEIPSLTLSRSSWDRLRYFHSSKRLSIGEKRNRLLDSAKGDIIFHFDDDDFYGPTYIADMMKMMEKIGSDLVLLSGFFCWQLNTGHFGYYRTLVKTGPAFNFNRHGVEMVKLDDVNIPWIHLCYGWSYIYRKKIWEKNPFDAINTFEDRQFVLAAQRNFKVASFESKRLNCAHSVHNFSSSQCFPQFMIPEFVMGSLSPEAHRHSAWLRSIAKTLNEQMILA